MKLQLELVVFFSCYQCKYFTCTHDGHHLQLTLVVCVTCKLCRNTGRYALQLALCGGDCGGAGDTVHIHVGVLVYMFRTFNGLVQSIECAMQSRNSYNV